MKTELPRRTFRDEPLSAPVYTLEENAGDARACLSGCGRGDARNVSRSFNFD